MIVTTKVFFPILGKKPWKVWKGVGSFLLFEFGKRQKDANGKTYGALTLWIYMANWRICRGSEELAHSESDDAKIGRAAAELTGQALEKIVLETFVMPRRIRYGARLFFEGGRRIDVFMHDRAVRDTIFMLYTPRTVVSYDYDGVLRSERLKKPRA